MFNNPNCAIFFYTNLAENLLKIELRGVHALCFFQVWPPWICIKIFSRSITDRTKTALVSISRGDRHRQKWLLDGAVGF